MAEAEDEAAQRLVRIKREIAELAGRPKAVEFSEIERIVHHLGLAGYSTESKARTHAHLFRVATERVTVCKHNARRKELKPVYVKKFLDAMRALGLLEDEEEG